MDEKDKRIQELEAENRELRKGNASLRALVTALEQRIVELEKRLNMNSSNSSKPPSTDGFTKPKPKSLRPKGDKKSGGQPGHKGHTLNLVSHPDHIIRHGVSACGKCGKDLSDVEPISIEKRQVFDIPPLKMTVTEHQGETKTCTCGCKTKAVFPDDVKATCQYGKEIQATVSYLSANQLLPEDRLQECMVDLFGIRISTATIVSLLQRTAEALVEKTKDTLNSIKKAAVKHLDETGFRVGKSLYWLQVISTNWMTYYWIGPKRKNLLEGIEGIVVHDHFKPYFLLPNVVHQLCNAHHLRELRALMEGGVDKWARHMYRLLVLISRYKKPPSKAVQWRCGRFYDELVSKGFEEHEALEELPQKSKGKRKNRPGYNLLVRLRDYKDDILRCLREEGVPFTNNQAEQDIRMMKVKQKISGCFRTEEGAQTFCIIRSFISTNRKQGLNVLEQLRASL